MCSIDCFRWCSKVLALEEVQGKQVLEVGSCDVNGSLRWTIQLLQPASYVGVDIAPGPGVDVICQASNLEQRFGANAFDVVLSTCVLEHIRDWKSAVSNIKRVCRPGGLILLIVPNVFPFHGFPDDFWRFAPQDFSQIFSDCETLAMEEQPRPPSLVFAKLRKPNSFLENDLSRYALRCVFSDRRLVAVQDSDMRSLRFRYLSFRSKMTESLLRAARRGYSKLG